MSLRVDVKFCLVCQVIWYYIMFSQIDEEKLTSWSGGKSFYQIAASK